MRSGTRGLGLHIVAEIAHALGAGLRMDRAPGDAGLVISVALSAE